MNNTTEQWRDIVGYEGIYEVSSLGRIKRIAAGRGAVPGRILKQYCGNRRYVTAILCKHSMPKTYSAHRLVAEAFHGACPAGYEVNHMNGNTHDNRADNLEWVTPTANKRHLVRALGNDIGEKHPMAKLTETQVRQIRHLYATESPRLAELAQRFPVTKSAIWAIVQRKVWRHI